MSGRPAVLITDASQRIGEATARRLAAAGNDLTISGRDPAPLYALAAELSEIHPVSVAVTAADMLQEEDVTALAAAHLRWHERLDVLVLNAELNDIGPISDYPVRRLDRMFTANVRSAYLLIQAVLPALLEAGQTTVGGGKVIAIASHSEGIGEPLNAAHGATKSALIALCTTLCAEHSADGVIATAVYSENVAISKTESLQIAASETLPAADVAEVVLGLTRLSKRTVVPSISLTRPRPHPRQA